MVTREYWLKRSLKKSMVDVRVAVGIKRRVNGVGRGVGRKIEFWKQREEA